MPAFDYGEPAGFFVSKLPRQMQYRSFAEAALAIRFAIEEVPAKQFASCVLEVGDKRFQGKEIRRLYDAPEYPLARSATELAAA